MVATALPSAALWMTTFPEPAFTLSLRVRTSLAVTETVVDLPAGVVPDRLGGVVSGGGEAITSSLAMTCHDEPRLVPIGLVVRTVVPFISQTAAWPLSFCHTMSDLPSPLKSSAPLTCHDVPRLEPTLALLRRVNPFFSPNAAWPLSFCHRMSALPSPSKSPGPFICPEGP